MQGFFYNHNGVNGTLWFRVISDGCKDDIPQRGFVWKIYMAQPKGFVMEEMNVWDATCRYPFMS